MLHGASSSKHFGNRARNLDIDGATKVIKEHYLNILNDMKAF